MSSSKDVARMAGVSPQTVSNVFNSPQIVRPRTRQAVLEAAKQLGYTPNASARRLRTRRSDTIAIGIAPHTKSAVYDRLLHALVSESDRHGIKITLYKTDSFADEIRHFDLLCAGADVDAFILTDTTHDDPRPRWLNEHGQTFVLFGRPWGEPDMLSDDIAWVDIDGHQGMIDITQHLILDGHKRIGFIGWPRHSGTGDDRLSGWKEAIVKARLASESQADTLCIHVNDDISAGQNACVELLDRHPDIDAIVCVSDTLATGALMASPDGLTVTGFDNTVTSRSLGFASIDQNPQDIAIEMLRIISERLTPQSGNSTERRDWHVLLKPTPIYR